MYRSASGRWSFRKSPAFTQNATRASGTQELVPQLTEVGGATLAMEMMTDAARSEETVSPKKHVSTS